MSTLDQIVADLQYAAGPGGASLAAQITRDGRHELEVGTAVRTPGPGLRAHVVKRGVSRSDSPGSAAPLTEVLNSQAARAANDGVAMALGRKR